MLAPARWACGLLRRAALCRSGFAFATEQRLGPGATSGPTLAAWGLASQRPHTRYCVRRWGRASFVGCSGPFFRRGRPALCGLRPWGSRPAAARPPCVTGCFPWAPLPAFPLYRAVKAPLRRLCARSVASRVDAVLAPALTLPGVPSGARLAGALHLGGTTNAEIHRSPCSRRVLFHGGLRKGHRKRGQRPH